MLRCKPNDDEPYLWVKATVSEDRVSIRYRVSGLDTDGSETFEEDASSWSVKEIQNVIGLQLNIMEEDRHLIQVF